MNFNNALNFDKKMTFKNELSFLRSAGAPGYNLTFIACESRTEPLF